MDEGRINSDVSSMVLYLTTCVPCTYLTIYLYSLKVCIERDHFNKVDNCTIIVVIVEVTPSAMTPHSNLGLRRPGLSVGNVCSHTLMTHESKFI